MDTALGTRAARGALELHLAELGLCFQDVKTILLTHHHPDHYGLSGFFEGLGARVFLHEEEFARGHRFWREPEAFAEASWRLFLDHGTPEGALQGIRETVEKTRERVHPPQNPLPLRDGEALEVAGKRLRVLWTPGHADGHAAFYLEEEGVLLAGDALLEKVSPNVGLWAYTRENPLKDFLRSLDRLADLGARVAYAGHFGPIADVRQRAEELKAHHQARLEGPPRPPGRTQNRLGALPPPLSPGAGPGGPALRLRRDPGPPGVPPGGGGGGAGGPALPVLPALRPLALAGLAPGRSPG